jgi:hypothetical protein
MIPHAVPVETSYIATYLLRGAHHANHGNGGAGAAVFGIALRAGSSGVVLRGEHAPLWFRQHAPMGDAGLAVLSVVVGGPSCWGGGSMPPWHGVVTLAQLWCACTRSALCTSAQCEAFGGRESAGGSARSPGSLWLVRGVVAATVLVARMCQSLLRGAGCRLPARTQGAEWACMRVVMVVAQCAVATAVLLATRMHRPSTTRFCVALPGRGEVGGSVGPRPSSS